MSTYIITGSMRAYHMRTQTYKQNIIYVTLYEFLSYVSLLGMSWLNLRGLDPFISFQQIFANFSWTL